MPSPVWLRQSRLWIALLAPILFACLQVLPLPGTWISVALALVALEAAVFFPWFRTHVARVGCLAPLLFAALTFAGLASLCAFLTLNAGWFLLLSGGASALWAWDDPTFGLRFLRALVFFLGTSGYLAGVAATLAHFFAARSVGAQFAAWWRAELGEPPAAYAVALLWILFVGETVALWTNLFRNFEPSLESLSLFSYGLPVALFVAVLHAYNARSHPRTPAGWLAATGVGLALGLGVERLHTFLPVAPTWFGVVVPSPVASLISTAWQVMAFGCVFSLAATRRHRLAVGLQILVVGLGAGALVAIIYAYPLCAWVFDRLTPLPKIAGDAHVLFILVSQFLGVLVVLYAGSVAVVWSRPATRAGQFVVGALTGAVGGAVVFGLLLAPLAGVMAQTALYGVAITRVGYGELEWLLKLAHAVNFVFPVMFVATWLAIGIGATVGGITGMFTPVATDQRQARAISPTQIVSELSGQTNLMVWLAFDLFVVYGTLILLGPQLQDIYDRLGVVPLWSPAWNLPLSVLPRWLFLIGLLAVTLVWLYRFQLGLTETTAPFARVSERGTLRVIAGAMLGFALLWMTLGEADPLTHIVRWAVVVFAVEIWIGLDTARVALPAPPRERSDWTGSGIVYGFFVGVFSYQFIAIALSLVLVAIVLIAELIKTTAPPPGVEWLAPILATQVTLTPITFLSFIVVYMVFGIFGGAINRWVFKRFAALFFDAVDGAPTLKPFWAGTLKRLPRGSAQRLAARIRAGFTARVVGLVCVVLAGWSVWRGLPLLVAVGLALVATLLFTRRLTLRAARIPLPVFALAFVLVWLGILVLSLSDPANLNDAWGLARLGFAVSVGAAAGIGYRALVIFTPAASVPRMRLTALLGIVVLSGLLQQANQEQVEIAGNVSRYDGERWKRMTDSNSPLAGALNYQFFLDRQRQVWVGGGTGALVAQTAQGWQSYFAQGGADRSRQSRRERAQLMARQTFFEQDRADRLWIVFGEHFGVLTMREESSAIVSALTMPSRQPTAAELEYFDRLDETALQKALQAEPGTQWRVDRLYETDPPKRVYSAVPNLAAPIADLALDAAGDLWIATAGSGALRLRAGRAPDDARWDFFGAHNSGLITDTVNVLLPMRDASMGFGTARGVSRFDGKTWETFPGLDAPVHGLLEDSQARVWAGTATGAYQLSGKQWTRLGELENVTTLARDAQDGVWLGGPQGAVRWVADRAQYTIRDFPVTKIIPGVGNTVWLGGAQGLMRYNLATSRIDLFNAENSGMATNWVRDLLLDPTGDLWVSTFVTTVAHGSPWSVMILGALFFSYLFAQVARGYNQMPEARARRVVRQIARAPDIALGTYHDLLATAPDAGAVLANVATQTRLASTWSTLATTLVPLAPDHAPPDAGTLTQVAEQLAAERAVMHAPALGAIYRMFAQAYAAKTPAHIAAWSFKRVADANGAMPIALGENWGPVNLPPFLAPATLQLCDQLQRTVGLVAKSLQVSGAPDQMIYLTDALSEIERAARAADTVPPPERAVLRAIALNWSAIIQTALNNLSGRAELRLELRTHQVRRAAQTTLVVRVQNVGRAVAENVRVALLPGEQVAEIERLASGASASVEFTAPPPALDAWRVQWRATWDDRVASGNQIEFADVARLYATAEQFQRIPNPYIVGLPVKSAEMFHGREDVFAFIRDNWFGATQDRTLVLHGQRRTGKTSILYQLLNGRLGEAVVPVLLDMQELAPLIQTTGDLLGEVAYKIAQSARKHGIAIAPLAEDRLATAPVRAFNRFVDALEAQLGGRRLALLFDEFELLEQKIREGKLDADILYYLRSLIQHRQGLVFIFTGTHRLEEMTHDYWSILFNLALYRRISFLSAEDAARLIRQPVAGWLAVDELAVEKIVQLTSGHPYFIQLLCWALVNQCNARERNYATLNDVNDVVRDILTTGEAHFAYIWQSAAFIEKLALAGLAHALPPGREWARPPEVFDRVRAAGDSQVQASALTHALDQLARQEVVEVAKEGPLQYQFKIPVLKLWIETNKSLPALIELGK